MSRADRIAHAFDPERLKAVGKSSAFVSYTCAGDPDLDTSVKIYRSLIEAGVDVLEIGVPFSDPLADGPTNQRASERTLANGMTSDRVFELVRRVREISDEVPIVFYTYYNLVFSRGHEEYIQRAKAAGVDGILVLDLPPEEGEDHLALCKKHDLKTVLIVAPTTPESRLPLISAAATGFIYYVSREGVTGERTDLAQGVEESLQKIRGTTTLPVVVGFGISNQEQVRATAKSASGVVVGSAIVKKCENLSTDSEDGWAEFDEFLRDLVAGCTV